jgi:hypothetical protein
MQNALVPFSSKVHQVQRYVVAKTPDILAVPVRVATHVFHTVVTGYARINPEKYHKSINNKRERNPTTEDRPELITALCRP